MSRLGNSKKYNDMCNHYESIISELQSELCMLQQAYNEVVENYMDLVAVVHSMDVLSRLEQQEDEVSQIETGKE